MRLRYHEDRRFYKPESGCPSSLYGEKRVTDVTKETLTRQVISPMIHLTFFLSQKIDISATSSIHLEKKNPVTHYDMHSPVTYDHMNKPLLLTVKPRSRRRVYNCLEAKILKNHDTFQINCILGVCLARLEIEFGKDFYFLLSILNL